MKKKLFSVLLVLCLALTLLPGMALAESGNFAEITSAGVTTQYSDASQFFSALQSLESGTVKLLSNYQIGAYYIPVASNQTITLDLAEYTLSGNPNTYLIQNSGSLTVTGNGTIYNTNTSEQGCGVIKNEESGNLVIENGTFGKGGKTENDCTRGNTIRNFGTATIKSGTFTCCDNYVNDGYAYPIANSAGTMTIENAIVSGNTNGIFAADGGTIIIKDGIFTLGNGTQTNLFYMFYGDGTIQVEGGSFTRNTNNNNGFLNLTNDGMLTISGGTFKDIYNTKLDLSLYVADGSLLTESNGTITVEVLDDTNSAAKIGTKYYATLPEAIAAAENGDTVKLLDDVTTTNAITIDKTLTIDTNGKTLTRGGTLTAGTDTRIFKITSGTTTLTGGGKLTINACESESNNGMLRIDGGGTLIVNDATVETANNIVYAVGMFGGTLTVNDGGVIKSSYGTNQGIAINTNGTDSWPVSTITVNGGTITGGKQACYLAGKSQTVNILDGSIIGGIETKAGTVNISGGTVTKSGEDVSHSKNSDGNSTTGYAIALVENASYQKDGTDVTVNISGGTIEGEMTCVTDSARDGDEKLTLTGGTFSTDPTAYIASGYQVRENADSTFTVFYPYTPPVDPPVVDVPVGGDEGGVTVPVQVDKDKGEASLVVDDKKLDEIVSSGTELGTVAIDMSALDSSVKTVNLPAKTVNAINEAVQAPESKTGGLSVALPAATIEFDAASLGEVAKAMKDAPEAPVAITAQQVSVTDLPESQQATVGKDAVIIDLSVQVGEKKVSDFGGGSVAVTVKYTPKEGADTNAIVVWFLSDDGTLTPCTCKYENGKLSFATAHFSKYVVGEFPFTDVKGGEWYYENVVYAYTNGIMKGISTTEFGPAAETSRAMVVTMLWRLEGEPSSSESPAFTDVPSDAYYAKAVAWAAEKKIVEGNGDGTFSPDTAITREQLAAILHRYSGKPAAAGQLEFPDAEKVSDWAYDSMVWATAKGLIKGSDGMLMPQGVAQRCQVAAIFQRMAAK